MCRISGAQRRSRPLIEVVKTWSVSRRSCGHGIARQTRNARAGRLARVVPIQFISSTLPRRIFTARDGRTDGRTDKWTYVVRTIPLERPRTLRQGLPLASRVLGEIGGTRRSYTRPDIFLSFLFSSLLLSFPVPFALSLILSAICAIEPLERSLRRTRRPLRSLETYFHLYEQSSGPMGRHVSTNKARGPLGLEAKSTLR